VIVHLTLKGEAAAAYGPKRLAMTCGSAWDPAYEILTPQAVLTGRWIGLADIKHRDYPSPLRRTMDVEVTRG